MNWVLVVGAALVLPMLIALGVKQIHERGYAHGYETAQAAGQQALAELNLSYARQLADQAQLAHQRLQLAVDAAGAIERQYLHDQQLLQTEIQQLQEQRDAALIDQPDCHFNHNWVRHYSAALGLPGAGDTAGGAADPADTTRLAANPATLLQHAQDYGRWCRANAQRLTALQQLIQRHQEQDDGI